MNRVILMGRLTADPEIRYTQDGKAVGTYTLAVDRRAAKQEQKADYIRCQVWEKKAEFAEKYLRKGTKLVVQGRIQTGSYDKDGRKVYTTDVVIEDQEFAESKKTEPEAASAPRTDKGYQDAGEFMTIPDGMQEELPFN